MKLSQISAFAFVAASILGCGSPEDGGDTKIHETPGDGRTDGVADDAPPTETSPDSGAPSDTGAVVDTGVPLVDTGTPPADTGTAVTKETLFFPTTADKVVFGTLAPHFVLPTDSITGTRDTKVARIKTVTVNIVVKNDITCGYPMSFNVLMNGKKLGSMSVPSDGTSAGKILKIGGTFSTDIASPTLYLEFSGINYTSALYYCNGIVFQMGEGTVVVES
jgi:hypothetical protein